MTQTPSLSPRDPADVADRLLADFRHSTLTRARDFLDVEAGLREITSGRHHTTIRAAASHLIDVEAGLQAITGLRPEPVTTSADGPPTADTGPRDLPGDDLHPLLHELAVRPAVERLAGAVQDRADLALTQALQATLVAALTEATAHALTTAVELLAELVDKARPGGVRLAGARARGRDRARILVRVLAQDFDRVSHLDDALCGVFGFHRFLARHHFLVKELNFEVAFDRLVTHGQVAFARDLAHSLVDALVKALDLVLEFDAGVAGDADFLLVRNGELAHARVVIVRQARELIHDPVSGPPPGSVQEPRGHAGSALTGRRDPVRQGSGPAQQVSDVFRQVCELSVSFRTEVRRLLGPHPVVADTLQAALTRPHEEAVTLVGQALRLLSDMVGQDLRTADVRGIRPEQLGGVRWSSTTRWPPAWRTWLWDNSVQVGPDQWEVRPGVSDDDKAGLLLR